MLWNTTGVTLTHHLTIQNKLSQQKISGVSGHNVPDFFMETEYKNENCVGC